MQQALRIFAHVSIGSTLPRPRRGVLVTPLHLVEAEDEAPPPCDIDEARIIDLLASAPELGETIEAAYRRKERELGELFRSLPRAEAAALHRRLTADPTDDILAQRFSRLVIDRRTRLLAILADAPRREARTQK